MRPKLLFPSYFRLIGIIMLLPGLVCGCLTLVFPVTEGFYDECAITLLAIGLLFIGFSRLGGEDESTGKIRLNSLYCALLVDLFCVAILWLLILANSAILTLFSDKDIQIFADLYNWLFILVLFICRFYFVLYKRRAKWGGKPVWLIPFWPLNIIAKAGVLSIVILLTIAAAFNLKQDIYANVVFLAPLALLLLIGSKARNETEEVTNIRLNAMQEAVYINYILFLLATWTVYGVNYFLVLMISLISIPSIFLFVFYVTYFRSLRRNRVLSAGASQGNRV